MSQLLPVSAMNYCQAQPLTELEESVRQALPISSYPLPDGSHQVISHYSDIEWQLENARFPSNKADSYKKIRFNTIPSQFIEPVKFALKNYDIKNSPAGNSFISQFKDLKQFLKYLDDIGIQCASKITPLLCANYVFELKTTISKQTKKALSVSSLTLKFLTVENFCEHLFGTHWAFKRPWVDSSASYLAGNHSLGKKTAKTEVIPDDQLQKLITYCNKLLKQAKTLIKLKGQIEIESEKLRLRIKDEKNVVTAITNDFLKPKGYSGGKKEFNALYGDIPSAMAIIILTFSGIRSHELCAIQNDAYRVQDEEDDLYYYLKSHSSKTHEGFTEWLVPEIVIKAINVQKAFVKPLQEELLKQQLGLLTQDPNDYRGLAINDFKDHLFLSISMKKSNEINSLSARALDDGLKKLCEHSGVEAIAPHQFRRTFAVYVSRSAYGDLRYLKEHFKHWSMDMTLLYAANPNQAEDLYNEVAIEVKNHKISIVEGFLEDDAIIAGGLANNIITYRSKDEAVKIFGSRAEMAEKISDTIHIRSTGHSWCTSDNLGCGGRSVIEATRCVDCKDSIVEKKRHGEYFKAVYLQQIELRSVVEDIGPVGKQRVDRDIKRCEQVLKDLGMWNRVQEAKGMMP